MKKPYISRRSGKFRRFQLPVGPKVYRSHERPCSAVILSSSTAILRHCCRLTDSHSPSCCAARWIGWKSLVSVDHRLCICQSRSSAISGHRIQTGFSLTPISGCWNRRRVCSRLLVNSGLGDVMMVVQRRRYVTITTRCGCGQHWTTPPA